MHKKLSPFFIIMLCFLGVILLGAGLLCLPVAAAEESATFGEALFTATSAVCVTGLVVRDTATFWSPFGQAVLLGLIQIGGLGVICAASAFVMLSGKRILLRQREILSESVSAHQVGGVMRLTGFIVAFTLIAEAIGAVLLSFRLVPLYGWEGVWMSVFTSVSAFCNAGFDLMGGKTGHFSSMMGFGSNGYVVFVLCLLIIAGGLGFMTWEDILHQRRNFKKYRLQSKVILATTAVLLAVPFLFYFFLEFNEGPAKQRLLDAAFQTVTARTAGFNTADLAAMSGGGKTVMILLMLIGGAPGSTAGGLKTTTAAMLAIVLVSQLRRKKDVECFGRRIDDDTIKKTLSLFALYGFLFVFGAVAISAIEGAPMGACLFETGSAVATVGLSLGLTPTLGLASRAILIVLMFIGRVGGLTLILAAASVRDNVQSRKPVEKISVG
ncbi:MAG: potassium transporter TrkG [Clostridia bacterium]|nr:potassium transporter TrkG [Clostridia bacterium]